MTPVRASAGDVNSPQLPFKPGDCLNCDPRFRLGGAQSNRQSLKAQKWTVVDIPGPSILRAVSEPTAAFFARPKIGNADALAAHRDGPDLFLHTAGLWEVFYNGTAGASLEVAILDAYHIADSGVYQRQGWNAPAISAVALNNGAPTQLAAFNPRRRMISVTRDAGNAAARLWTDNSVSATKGWPIPAAATVAVPHFVFSETSPLGLWRGQLWAFVGAAGQGMAVTEHE